jgi:hypothetical protein
MDSEACGRCERQDRNRLMRARSRSAGWRRQGRASPCKNSGGCFESNTWVLPVALSNDSRFVSVPDLLNEEKLAFLTKTFLTTVHTSRYYDAVTEVTLQSAFRDIALKISILRLIN